MQSLLILTTGGTIDKIYLDDKSDYQVGEPQIGRILKELGVVIPFTVLPVMLARSMPFASASFFAVGVAAGPSAAGAGAAAADQQEEGAARRRGDRQQPEGRDGGDSGRHLYLHHGRLGRREINAHHRHAV